MGLLAGPDFPKKTSWQGKDLSKGFLKMSVLIRENYFSFQTMDSRNG